MHTDNAAQRSADQIRLYDQILSCETAADAADTILSPIADMLDARSGVFIQICASSLGRRHFGAHSHVGITSRTVEDYIENGLYERDPVMQPAIAKLRGGLGSSPFILSGSVEANLDRDSLYRDNFLRPYDIGHVLAIAVPIRTALETQLACLGFHRRHGDKRFLPDHVARFQQLGPALRASLYGLASRESVELSDAIMVAAREGGRDMGYVILDEDLIIRNANARGLEDLALTGNAAGASMLLSEIKQSLIEEGLADGDCLKLSASTPCPVDVSVRNFRSTGGEAFYLVATASAGPNRAIGDACRRYGLTSRETEIAMLVAAGKCNASLSRELGISLRTGENHLRAIYRKVAVTSRTQLISRLMQIQ